MINSVMPASYVQSVMFPQQNSSQPLTETYSGSENKPATDIVTISDESRLLSVSGSFPTSIEELEQSLANTTAFVEKRLKSLYQQLGIDSGSKMDFSVGYDGKIQVNGESPDAKRLAEAINEDEELSNSIRRMSADAGLLEAFKQAQEFNEAYEKDPVAALQRYGFLFEDGRECNVSFSMQDGAIDITTAYI